MSMLRTKCSPSRTHEAASDIVAACVNGETRAMPPPMSSMTIAARWFCETATASRVVLL
jgi:hypothetical protein